MRLGPTLGPRRGLWPRALPSPSGFGWTLDFAIRQLGPRAFTADLDTADLEPVTTVDRWVDIVTGNNADSGLTFPLAHKAIWDMLNAVSAATTVYILGSADPADPTVYDYDNAWRFGTAGNLRVIVVSDAVTLAPGYAISSTYTAPGGSLMGTWGLTADPGGPNVYEATLVAAPDRVIDATVPDEDGIPTKLTLQTSIANVEANPGSYYHAGGKLYVRTFDSRAPDGKLRPLKASVTNGHVNGGKTVHITRLSFEGGGPARAFYVQDGYATLVDCDVTHGQALGFEVNLGAGITDTRTANLIRCRFIANGGDGCGYAAAGAGATINAFEWGCTYARNTSAAGSDQGGSAHRLLTNGAVRVVRLDPDCRENKSQGFADVGENVGANDNGCEIWIVGGSVADEAVGVYAGNGTKTWLHAVQMTGNTVDLKTDAAAGRIYLADMPLGSRTGAGVVQYFTP